MKLGFSTVDINRFDELNIFEGLKEDFPEYKDKRINMIQRGQCDVFVAMDDDRYIGEVTAKYINEDLDNETIPNTRAYFEAFRIHIFYQDVGIGQQLMNYAIDYLKNKGYTEFTVGVESWNRNAVHIYQKLGFTEKINIGKTGKYGYDLYLKRV